MVASNDPIEVAPQPAPPADHDLTSEKDLQELDRDDDERNSGAEIPQESILPVSTEQQQPAALTKQTGNNSEAEGWTLEKVKAFLYEDVDTDAATGPLAAFCFMTVRPSLPLPTHENFRANQRRWPAADICIGLASQGYVRVPRG